jgi:hypothetical protein
MREETRHALRPQMLLGQIPANHYIRATAVAAVVQNDPASTGQQRGQRTPCVVVIATARGEDDGGSRAVFFIEQINAIDVDVGHGLSNPISELSQELPIEPVA